MQPTLACHSPQSTTPSAAALLFSAILGFGAAWGVQIMAAVRTIPSVEVQPVGYWFVYGLVAAAGAIALAWMTQACRVRLASALNHKPTKRWDTQEAVREYLLLRDARTRNREVTGTGGPCMTPKWKAYFEQNARRADG